MKYFIQTTHFVPNSYEEFGFVQTDDHLYRLQEDGSFWIERMLYDLGWGREKGFCRLPLPSFEQLLSLVFIPSKDIQGEQRYNYWGALAVLLDDHCMDLLQYIQKNVQASKDFAKKHLHVLSYIDSVLNVNDHQVLALSNRGLTNCCQKWKELKRLYEIL